MDRCLDQTTFSPRQSEDGRFASDRAVGGLRRGGRRDLHPLVAALLALGLVAAVVTDGALPGLWSKALFGVLLVLDAITIEWLTRPRDA